MRVQLLRNATLVIDVAAERILVDPMLAAVGTLLPFAAIRHAPRRNPIVPLPDGADAALRGITAALITHCRHGHVDHLDEAGRALLAEREVPVYCAPGDAAHLARRGLRAIPLAAGVTHGVLGGQIRTVPATHGHGLVGAMMGAGVGYLLAFPGEPSLYLSGDTVLTGAVEAVLRDHRPELSVVHAGGASLDVGRPILMTVEEVVSFVRLAPGVVIATHLEALNHCPTTRVALREALERADLAHKVRIPADGEQLAFGA